MRVLVTGATGLLGNNVVRYFLEQGHQVACAVRRPDPKSLAGLAVTQVLADLGQTQDWSPHLESVDAVVHCAARIHIGWTLVPACHQINVEGTARLAQAARTAKCRMIHVSTVDTLAYSVDGRAVAEGQRHPAKPQCNYVVTKTAAEQVIQQQVQQGLDAIIVHPGFMIGPWDWAPSSGKMVQAIATGQIPVAPAGGCSAADVRSVAQAIEVGLRQGARGEHYILAGHNLTYQALFEKIAQVVGRRAPRFKLGPAVAWGAGAVGDLLTKVMRKETDFNSAMIRMGQRRNFYSSAKAERELHYQIPPIEPAIEASWQFLRQEHQA